ERVLTGSKATRWNPSLRRPYWPSAARVTSCHCPDSFRYCSTQLRGGIMPEFASSGLSRYHHTPTSSTVTSKSQVSVAHCSPTWLHVPQLSPYSAALSSKRSLSPSFSPPTDSQSAVKEASGSAYGARFPVSSAPSAGGICTGSWFVFPATSAARTK